MFPLQHFCFFEQSFWTSKHRICANYPGGNGRRRRWDFSLSFVISFLNTGIFSAFNHVLTLPSLNRTHSVLTCVVGTVLFHGRRHPTGRRSHSATGMKIFTAACAVVGSWTRSQNVPKILINIPKRFLKASNSRKRSSPNSFTSIWATEQ